MAHFHLLGLENEIEHNLGDIRDQKLISEKRVMYDHNVDQKGYKWSGKSILKTLIILTFFSVSYAEEKKYDQKTCEEIYVGIAYFLKAADKNWKETKDENKASMYVDEAANYMSLIHN